MARCIPLFLCAVILGCADLDARRFYQSGTAALDRGESQRAVADLERAASLAPEISEIQNHLGIAYEEVGRSDDARLSYERAVELDCDNQAAKENLRRLDDPRPRAEAGEPNTSQGASR